MRVITGTARGRRLITLEGEQVRPTSERVKEALFSIIQFELEGRRVLDLFAGSGQLGIEALSRGAACAVFVDNSRRSLAVVRQNLTATGLLERARLHEGDSLSFLQRSREMFDIVFIDPPYNTGLAAKSLENAKPLVRAGGVIICETPKQEVLPDDIGEGFSRAKRYFYGKISLTVYRSEAGLEDI